MTTITERPALTLLRNDQPTPTGASDRGVDALMRETVAELRRTQAAVLKVTEDGATIPLMEMMAVLRELGYDIRGLAYATAIGERLDGGAS